MKNCRETLVCRQLDFMLQCEKSASTPHTTHTFGIRADAVGQAGRNVVDLTMSWTTS